MPYRLVDANGELIAGDAELEIVSIRTPISHDFEKIGYIESDAEDTEDSNVRMRSAAMFVELLAQSCARYIMAASLHLEAVHSDHEVLQQKHRALQESEKRYRDLASSLECEVKRQISVIESAQRQLYETEKLASVGQLAAGMAHEINNPIGFIKSNLGTAKSYIERLNKMADSIRLTSDKLVLQNWRHGDCDFVLEDFSSLLEECIHGADRVARIITDLKKFSNIDLAEIRETDLNEQLKITLEMAKMAYPPSIVIDMQLSELPIIQCQVSRINQALINIFHNAGQALASGGTLTVSSANLEKHINIRISDNGEGMSSDVLSRAFEPFFTTRDVGKGTGLGLTVARDVIHAHSGKITLDSTPGEGTVVTILLPILQEAG